MYTPTGDSIDQIRTLRDEKYKLLALIELARAELLHGKDDEDRKALIKKLDAAIVPRLNEPCTHQPEIPSTTKIYGHSH